MRSEMVTGKLAASGEHWKGPSKATSSREEGARSSAEMDSVEPSFEPRPPRTWRPSSRGPPPRLFSSFRSCLGQDWRSQNLTRPQGWLRKTSLRTSVGHNLSSSSFQVALGVSGGLESLWAVGPLKMSLGPTFAVCLMPWFGQAAVLLMLLLLQDALPASCKLVVRRQWFWWPYWCFGRSVRGTFSGMCGVCYGTRLSSTDEVVFGEFKA